MAPVPLSPAVLLHADPRPASVPPLIAAERPGTVDKLGVDRTRLKNKFGWIDAGLSGLVETDRALVAVAYVASCRRRC